MNREISVATMWQVFKNCWKVIIIITVVAMLIMGLVTNFMIKKVYSSSVRFYVINTNGQQDFEQTALVTVKEQLSKEYIQIIFSDVVLIPIAQELKTNEAYKDYGFDYTAAQIKSMLSASTLTDIGIFDIKVKNNNSDHAYIIAKAIAEKAPSIVKEVKKPWTTDAENISGTTSTELQKEFAECISVLNHPKKAISHDSPSLVKNVALAAIIAAVATYAVFFLIAMLDTGIKTEDDVKKITNKYPIIGVIPTWSEK